MIRRLEGVMDMRKALLLPFAALVAGTLATACIGEDNTQQTITPTALLQAS